MLWLIVLASDIKNAPLIYFGMVNQWTALANRNGAFEWFGMINHSGQIENAYLQPVSIHNTTVRFKPVKPLREIRLVRSGDVIKFTQNNGWIETTIPRIDDFEMVLCLYR